MLSENGLNGNAVNRTIDLKLRVQFLKGKTIFQSLLKPTIEIFKSIIELFKMSSTFQVLGNYEQL